MPSFLKTIFFPRDGSRRNIIEREGEARQKTLDASSKLEDTIDELLSRLDKLKGKHKKDVKGSK